MQKLNLSRKLCMATVASALYLVPTDMTFVASALAQTSDNISGVAANAQIPEYNRNKAYFGNTVVSYNGMYFKAKWWTLGDTPVHNPTNPWDTPWQVISAKEAMLLTGVVINSVDTAVTTTPDSGDAGPEVVDQVADQPDTPSVSGKAAGGVVTYDSAKNYNGGAYVFQNGHYYKAKWFANVGQAPDDVVVHAWETPWEIVTQAEAVASVGVGVKPDELPPLPVPPSTPELPDVAEVQETPGLPEAPEVSEIDELAESNSIPELPELPKVPEIPEVPEIQGNEVNQDLADTPEPTPTTPEIGTPEIGALETGAPEIERPEIGALETGTPETIRPEIGALETGAPEIERPEIGTLTANENIPEGVVTYKVGQDYLGESVVFYNGKYYKAKWWTKPHEVPGAKVANVWDSPWQLISKNEAMILAKVAPFLPDTSDASGGSVDAEAEAGEPQTVRTLPTYTIRRSELRQREQQVKSDPAIRANLLKLVNLPDNIVNQIMPGNPANPENVRRVERIISAETFDFIFPYRNPGYTYGNFLKAFGKWPVACRTYVDGRDSEQMCRRLLAAIVAHFAQETGKGAPEVEMPKWRQGLYYLREINRGEYCNLQPWVIAKWPCTGGQKYFGRGAKQLSWNYNYGFYSEIATGNVETFLKNPEIVADTWHNLASAIFFFVTPQSPKPSMLDTLDGTWIPNANDIAGGRGNNFGTTTLIINGGHECQLSATERPQAANRIKYFRAAAAYLGHTIPENENLGCRTMQKFNSNSSAFVSAYWKFDSGWRAGTPGNKTYRCKPTSEHTSYSMFIDGHYEACVRESFSNVEILD